MASDSRGLRIGIQIVLGIIIVGLAYWLYVSITAPYERVERQREITERTRDRMELVRTALIQYERREDRFPGSLDSLVMWVKQDSFMQANQDSLFDEDFVTDSLPYSPRSGEQFEYVASDTGRIDIYYLKDPNSDDYIGTTDPNDVTMLNAASWE
jgi:type II secretory pathway pseudopilin PulG